VCYGIDALLIQLCQSRSRTNVRLVGSLATDLTDSSSWTKAKFWVKEVVVNEENARLFLVGTKSTAPAQPPRLNHSASSMCALM